MSSQTKETDTTLYLNIQFFGTIPQNGIFEVPSIQGLGLGYSMEIAGMVYKDKLELSFKIISQTNQIINLYPYHYLDPWGHGNLMTVIDRTAKLQNSSFLLGLNYIFRLGQGLSIKPYALAGLNLAFLDAEEPIYFLAKPGEPPNKMSSMDIVFSAAYQVGFNGCISINNLVDLNLGAGHFLSFLDIESFGDPFTKKRIAVHNLHLGIGVNLKF